MIEFAQIALIVLFGLMTMCGVIARVIRNMGVVDVFWGFGLGVLCVTLLAIKGGGPAHWLYTSLVCAWATRLSLFLFMTRVFVGHEDPRYTRLIAHLGHLQIIKVFGNFYLQAFLQFWIALSFFPIFYSDNVTLGLIQWSAAAIFVLSLIGQAVADLQLHRFKKSGEKGICRVGLWNLSRHPNYFFETLIWLSLASFSIGYSHHLIAWVSPLTLWIIVRFVTGPYTERVSLEKRGAAFEQYQQEVPFIVPSLKSMIRLLRGM